MTTFFKTSLFLVSFCFSGLYAQTPYSFLNLEKNKVYSVSEKSMDYFHAQLQKLETEKKGKVNIVHIGDSHIQAGHWTGKMRQLFQKKYGNGGRGFLFPYPIAQTNSPKDYETHFSGIWEGKRSVIETAFSRWGLAGLTAATYAPDASLTVKADKNQDPFKITKLKVFYPVFDVASFNIKVQSKGKNIEQAYHSRSGFVEYQFRQAQEAVTLKLFKTNGSQKQFVMQGLSLENDDSGVVYHAIGVNGAKTDTYFRCEDFVRHLSVLTADLVVVSLGANDAFSPKFDAMQYKTQLKELVKDIRQAAPKASIILTTTGDAYRLRKLNPDNGNARQKVYEVAEEMGLAVWDFYEIMGGFRSIEKWEKAGLCISDRLHLTEKGYQLQGDLFFEALEKKMKGEK